MQGMQAIGFGSRNAEKIRHIDSMLFFGIFNCDRSTSNHHKMNTNAIYYNVRPTESF